MPTTYFEAIILPHPHTDTSQGLTADTVTNFEVVTAAGEIINANKAENEDLFYALKGGGSQFAIVTEFTFQTFEVGSVWGGYKIYSLDQKEAILNATHDLVSDYYVSKVTGKTLAGSPQMKGPLDGVSSLREAPSGRQFPGMLPSAATPRPLYRVRTSS